MTMRSFLNLSRGDQLSASDYNRLTSEVERLSNLRPDPPLDMVNTPGGPLIRLDVSQLLSNGIPPGSVINYYNDTFNSTNDTYNYTNDTFNYYGTNVENIYNTFVTNLYGFWNVGYSTGGYGGITFDVPFEVCGYVFECCTNLSLSTAVVNNLALPAVGSPDRGAIIYDASTSAALPRSRVSSPRASGRP